MVCKNTVSILGIVEFMLLGDCNLFSRPDPCEELTCQKKTNVIHNLQYEWNSCIFFNIHHLSFHLCKIIPFHSISRLNNIFFINPDIKVHKTMKSCFGVNGNKNYSGKLSL